ncbi:hypothetical protein CTI12_AA010470 [Artemisia annua]|uniref:Reverse transcriptase domain-containing protein n=1 Tax=Artemisia annua TaxID=35608 RepID=A0A2U1QMH0_ARTAN|nr:hypothetical protein CTI12_AA010470 [Artemisia annua]
MQNQFHAPNNQYPAQTGNQGYSAPNYQEAPSNELNNYIKVNDAKIRVMQNQISTLKNDFQSSTTKQSNELKSKLMATNNKIDQSQNKIENMFTSLINHLAPPSTLGGLPGKTVVNPKGELKAITTGSGKAIDGPPGPIPPPFILQQDYQGYKLLRKYEKILDPSQRRRFEKK